MSDTPTTPGSERRYSFSPLEKRGVFLGLQPGQLLTLAVGILTSLVAGRVTSGPARLPVVVALLGASAAAALWPVSGRPLLGWVPLALRWLVQRAGSPRLSVEPQAGRVPGAATLPSLGPAPGRASLVPGVALLQARAGLGDAEIGIWRDSRYGTLGAVVPVRGRSFALLDPDRQIQHLDAWRAVLGALGRSGTPVRRVQWVQVSAPEGHIGVALRPPGPDHDDPVGHRARDSYVSLVQHAGPATPAHDVWIVLAVGASRPLGPDRLKATDVLQRELRLLAGQLRSADLDAGDPLRGDEIATLIGNPTAVEEDWSVLRADGDWHATYWVAEWPRVDVPPDFLAPMLVSEGRRAVSVVMAPVPGARAVREARSARTADLADAELRIRAGFVPSARRQREADGALRRESELADGHVDYRFSGYITVTATDRGELEVSCAETEHAAQAARIELRRLYGRQAESFTWTLPLARGLT